MRCLAVSLFLILSFWSSIASAQFYGTDSDDPGFITSTTTTTAVAVGTVILTVSLKGDPTNTVQAYLKQNLDEVRRGVALGGGDAIDDLAMILGYDRKLLGRVLRSQRKNVNTLLESDVSASSVRQFIELLEIQIRPS